MSIIVHWVLVILHVIHPRHAVHICLEIRVSVVQATVNDADLDLVTAYRDVPGHWRADAGHAPLVTKFCVIGQLEQLVLVIWLGGVPLSIQRLHPIIHRLAIHNVHYPVPSLLGDARQPDATAVLQAWHSSHALHLDL